jgi:hypothetical protein
MSTNIPINVRFPLDMYERVKQDAQANRRSLNSQVLIYVEEIWKQREAKMAQPQR